MATRKSTKASTKPALPFPPTEAGLAQAESIFVSLNRNAGRAFNATNALRGLIADQKVLCRAGLAKFANQLTTSTRLLAEKAIEDLPNTSFFNRLESLDKLIEDHDAWAEDYKTEMRSLEALQNALDEAEDAAREARDLLLKAERDIMVVRDAMGVAP